MVRFGGLFTSSSRLRRYGHFRRSFALDRIVRKDRLPGDPYCRLSSYPKTLDEQQFRGDEFRADFLRNLQLSETAGSSSMPPSVLPVLNYKTCRGAIMFGDALLPSECSLLVEELKQTSLCFQCAHGRPTTVTLVNLEALHKQIAKLELWKERSDETWRHGLRQHRPSLERAEHRLNLC